MQKKPSVLCLGSHIVDIINSPLKRFLKAGEGVTTTIGIHPGGNAFNVSADLAQLCGDSVSVSSTGTVGEDHQASLFRSEYSRLRVIPYLQTISEQRTGVNIILQVINEERRFHLDPGANPHITADFVLSTLDSVHPDFFYIGELSILGSCQNLLSEICSRVHQYGGKVFLDVMISEFDEPEYLFKAAHLIDFLHCNNYEAACITGHQNPDTAIKALYEKGFRLPVVSSGKKGLFCIHNDTLYTIPAFHVSEIDATGAGDAFVAGVLYCLTKIVDETLEEILSDRDTLFDMLLYGSASGACAVTSLGCTHAVTARNVDHLYYQQQATVRNTISCTPLLI